MVDRVNENTQTKEQTMRELKTNKRTAQEAYNSHFDRIEKALADIKKGLGKKQTGVNWGHVGDLAAYGGQLEEVADMLLKRGEYSPENIG